VFKNVLLYFSLVWLILTRQTKPIKSNHPTWNVDGDLFSFPSANVAGQGPAKEDYSPVVISIYIQSAKSLDKKCFAVRKNATKKTHKNIFVLTVMMRSVLLKHAAISAAGGY